jgi:hypothetical protein
MLKPVVQRAMARLTSRISMHTGLNDPGDRAAAVSLLNKLHSAGESFEPEELAAWASLNGWTPKGVAQIRRLAGDVLSGRESGAAHAAWDADIIEKLRAEGGVEPQP